MKIIRFVVALAISLFAVGASAQLLPYGPTISLDNAKKAAAMSR